MAKGKSGGKRGITQATYDKRINNLTINYKTTDLRKQLDTERKKLYSLNNEYRNAITAGKIRESDKIYAEIRKTQKNISMYDDAISRRKTKRR